MSIESNNGEPAGTNLLTGAVIVASAFMLYAALANWQPSHAVETTAQPTPAAEHVVAATPDHVS